MVKRFSLLMGLLGLSLAAGCQPTTSSTAFLPPPTFDGPKIAVRPPPAPVAPAPAPAPVKEPAPVAQTASARVPRNWVPTARTRPWMYIVIHHSATPNGGARTFDKMHRDKGWDELGYHFVIGNGSDSPDGSVEVGSRWPKQKYGAHCKTPDNRYNDFGIGICLVGNFDSTRPSQKQMESLAKLTSYLMKTYKIPASRVIGHGDAKPTDCPGRNLNVASIRRMATQILADAGETVEPELADSDIELLIDDGLPRQ